MKPSFAAAVVLAGLLSQPASNRQARQPNFSGVWVMDTTKFDKRDAVLVSLAITVTQGADTLSVKSEIGDRRSPTEITHTTTLANYLLNGQPLQNRTASGAAATAALSWDNETLVLRSSSPGPDGQQIEITTRWTLDPRGTRLTQVQRMHHGERVLNQTLLLVKQ